MLSSLTKIDQSTTMGKKGHTDVLHGQKANKWKLKQTEVETQQVIGCKMRFLEECENRKAFATITTSKEEVDYQFWWLEGTEFSRNTKHQD